MSLNFEQQRMQDYQLATFLNPESISSAAVMAASVITAAMVEKFNFSPQDVRTIPVAYENGTTAAAVVYTGPGLSEGSWDDIQRVDRGDYFALRLGSVSVGTREGMHTETYHAMYRALYTESLMTGKPCLTDHLPEDDPDYAQRTWTWLTGNFPVGNQAPIGVVRYAGQQTEIDARPRMGDYPAVRFRPAVVVTPLLVKTVQAHRSDST